MGYRDEYRIHPNTMKRIISDAGAKRIGAGAFEELSRIIEEKADEIAKEAILIAEDNERSTVKREDIITAADIVD